MRVSHYKKYHTVAAIQRIVGLLIAVTAAGLIWLYPAYTLLIKSPMAEITGFDWRLFAFGVVSQMFIHEIGHVVAGFAVGFRFLLIAVFPLLVMRSSQRWSLTPYFGLGQGGSAPLGPILDSDIPKLRKSLFRIFGGGPLFGFLGSTAALLAWFYLASVYPIDSSIVRAMKSSAIIGFVINLLNTLPLIKGTDGESLKIFARENEASLACTAVMAVTYSVASGTRFNAIDEKLRKLITSPSTSSSDEIIGLYYAYYAALSADEIDEADGYMQRLQEVGGRKENISWMMDIQTELAFFSGYYRGDPVVARRCWEGAKNSLIDPCNRARCEAAVLISENREEAARTVLESVADEMKQLPAHDPMRQIVSDLRKLAQRVGIIDVAEDGPNDNGPD
ncbi:MAG: cytochrome c oxidase subunit II [Phycisphaerae bacterium]|nr:MAG: cytochrome c oxidase subunit II [Phycisphaerae bacterium]